jgi:hypothetical protein
MYEKYKYHTLDFISYYEMNMYVKGKCKFVPVLFLTVHHAVKVY